MQFWQCPLLLMVSLIAAINTQQTPSQQRFEPDQVAELVELHQQLKPSREQQEQPAQADNKGHHFAPLPAVSQQLTPSDWSSTEDKRSWNRMQGMWGKRSQQQSDESATLHDMNPQRLVKRAWSDLSQQGWGKRSWAQLHGVWGKRRWDQLHGAWGKRTIDGQVDQQDSQEEQSAETEPEDMNDLDELETSKRSGWNKMQGVWGKRSGTSNLDGIGNNDLLLMLTGDQLYQRDDQPMAKQNDKLAEDGANGESADKRAWNQMQGVWGKRALSAMAAGYKRNWNNLRGAWGKREIPAAVAKGMEWSRKRESGWNNLKGLWG